MVTHGKWVLVSPLSAVGVFLFSFLCVLGSSLFALGSHFKGTPYLLPLMLTGRLLFGSGNGSLTSKAAVPTPRPVVSSQSSVSKLLCRLRSRQSFRTASRRSGSKGRSWPWLSVWLWPSPAWAQSWTSSSRRGLKRITACSGHSGVVGVTHVWEVAKLWGQEEF